MPSSADISSRLGRMKHYLVDGATARLSSVGDLEIKSIEAKSLCVVISHEDSRTTCLFDRLSFDSSEKRGSGR